MLNSQDVCSQPSCHHRSRFVLGNANIEKQILWAKKAPPDILTIWSRPSRILIGSPFLQRDLLSMLRSRPSAGQTRKRLHCIRRTHRIWRQMYFLGAAYWSLHRKSQSPSPSQARSIVSTWTYTRNFRPDVALLTQCCQNRRHSDDYAFRPFEGIICMEI